MGLFFSSFAAAHPSPPRPREKKKKTEWETQVDRTRTKPCLWLGWLKISMLGQVQMANSPRLQANLNHNSWDRPLFPTLMGTSCLLLIIWMITRKKKRSGGGSSEVREDIIFQTVGCVLLRTIWKTTEYESWKTCQVKYPQGVRSEEGSSYLCTSVFRWQGYLKGSNCICLVICWFFAFAFPLLLLDGFD